MNSALRAAAVACALATAASPALAGGMVIERVGYADLDLGSEAGRAKLESRVRWAAIRVCSDYQLPAPTGLSVNRDCFQKAMDDARQKLDHAIAVRESKQRSAAESVTRSDF